MVSFVREKVERLLADADKGHRIDHVDRVLDRAMKFSKYALNRKSEEETNASIEIIQLTALLHDVDDYKIVKEKSGDLSNARSILIQAGAPESLIDAVLSNISTIGFSTRLKGIKPVTIEAKIVSDADMCDGNGLTGIIRTIQYCQAHGRQFFHPGIYPRKELTYEQYVNEPSITAINHMFEKMLRIQKMVYTASGYDEALANRKKVIWFLRTYFRENGLSRWDDYLSEYLTYIDGLERMV